jgi:hypothetical protein
VTPAGPLLAALDAAYEAFSGYPRPARMEASPARNAAKILTTLSSVPLRRLSSEQIGPYAGWALTTIGSVEDYKHFLPRILEQAVRAPEWMGTQPSIIASKLKMANWRTWRKRETKAVLDVFAAALRHAVLGHPDDEGDASDWLCALASLGEDVLPYLREWLRGAQGNALLQIANLAMQLPTLTSLDEREQIFWADLSAEARAAIVTWLTSAQVSAALAGAVGIDENDAWRIEQGSSAIANFLESPRH